MKATEEKTCEWEYKNFHWKTACGQSFIDNWDRKLECIHCDRKIVVKGQPSERT